MQQYLWPFALLLRALDNEQRREHLNTKAAGHGITTSPGGRPAVQDLELFRCYLADLSNWIGVGSECEAQPAVTKGDCDDICVLASKVSSALSKIAAKPHTGFRPSLFLLEQIIGPRGFKAFLEYPAVFYEVASDNPSTLDSKIVSRAKKQLNHLVCMASKEHIRHLSPLPNDVHHVLASRMIVNEVLIKDAAADGAGSLTEHTPDDWSFTCRIVYASGQLRDIEKERGAFSGALDGLIAFGTSEDAAKATYLDTSDAIRIARGVNDEAVDAFVQFCIFLQEHGHDFECAVQFAVFSKLRHVYGGRTECYLSDSTPQEGRLALLEEVVNDVFGSDSGSGLAGALLQGAKFIASSKGFKQETRGGGARMWGVDVHEALLARVHKSDLRVPLQVLESPAVRTNKSWPVLLACLHAGVLCVPWVGELHSACADYAAHRPLEESVRQAAADVGIEDGAAHLIMAMIRHGHLERQ